MVLIKGIVSVDIFIYPSRINSLHHLSLTSLALSIESIELGLEHLEPVVRSGYTSTSGDED